MARKSRIPEKNKLDYPSLGYVRVGIYARLSKPDGDPISESIQNQIALANNYLKDHPEFVCTNTYQDDGYTGLTFHRPGFQTMLRDIKARKIDCVLVKDTSRIGRDYIAVGRLLCFDFPDNEIRFISINDNYDSIEDTDGLPRLDIILKTVLDNRASKDLSKKISSSIAAQVSTGSFLPATTSIPYGYLRDSQNQTYIVDEEVAPVVLRIFQLRAQGMNYTNIANTLNKDGIYCPGKLRYSRHLSRDAEYQDAIWVRGTVRNILNDQVYIGHRVHGKMKKPRLNVNKQYTEEDQWTIIKNVHPAIIPEELFYEVQKINEEDRRKRSGQNKRPEVAKDHREAFSGKLFCDDCGKPLLPQKAVARQNSKSLSYTYYDCSNYKYSNRGRCTCHYIRDDELTAFVMNTIEQRAKAVTSSVFYKRYIEIPMDRIVDLRRTVLALREEQKEHQTAIFQLYEEYLNQHIDDVAFTSRNTQMRARSLEINNHMNNLVQTLQPLEKSMDARKERIKALKDFLKEPTLTKLLMDKVVRCVTVDEARNIKVEFLLD